VRTDLETLLTALLALAAAIWHNWTIRTTRLRSLAAHDH
jgi:hypothetical protein